MALYSFANGQIIPALRLLYRARYLAVLIYGDDHPDMAQLDVSFLIFIKNCDKNIFTPFANRTTVFRLRIFFAFFARIFRSVFSFYGLFEN